MALPNIFKTKKTEKKIPAKKLEKKSKNVARESAEKKVETGGGVVQRKRVEVREAAPSIAWQVLKSPHVTEKAADLAEISQYVFRVRSGANKPMVKRAVEDLYGVEVVSVHITNVPPKKRMRGRIEGWRKGYKKAIVRIKEGQKIEILPR